MHVIGAPLWSFSSLTVSPVEGLLIASKPSSAPLIITLPVVVYKNSRGSLTVSKGRQQVFTGMQNILNRTL